VKEAHKMGKFTVQQVLGNCSFLHEINLQRYLLAINGISSKIENDVLYQFLFCTNSICSNPIGDSCLH